MSPETATALADRLYTALAAGDGATMAACYHPRAHFTDPVFDLQGAEVGAMWTMLTSNAQDFRAEHRVLDAGEDTVRVHWEAWYRFSATGRPVHNVIQSTLTLRDGLILQQQDSFDFWRWSRQALGVPGWLLGWTQFLRRKVQDQAATNLRRWRAKQQAR